MANGLFASYRTLVLGAGLNTSSLTINAIFIDATDDIPVLATDDFFDDLAGTPVPVEASAPALGTKTIGNPPAAGVFDAADTVFTSLSGDQVEYLVIYEDSGTTSTSDLIAMWDTATGIPLTPNGGNVTVVWSASGIYTF